MFLPASNLILPIGTIMGERLFYLPSVGLCWLVGLGWERILAWNERPFLRRAGWAVLGVLLLVFTAMTVRYGRVWRDDNALFSYAIQVAPRSAKIQLDFGAVLAATPGRMEEAIQHFRQSVEIYNAYGKAWDAMGRAYLELKRSDQAIAAFKEASALDPTDPNPYNNIGVAYVALAQWDDAMTAFRRAVALKPNLAQAHRNLADVYDKKGWTEAALAQRALELTPTDPLAWIQAGSTFLQLRWPEEALGAFREAVRLDPNLPEAHLRQAQAFESLDRFPEAAQAYEALLRLRPRALAIHRRLAELYTTRLGDPARAEAHLRQAQEAAPRPAGP
jgi:tetratricopeptide (TPR) repeat protein